MKRISTIRRVDKIGRLVIPILIRQRLGIKSDTYVVLEFESENNRLIIRRATEKDISCEVPEEEASR